MRQTATLSPIALSLALLGASCATGPAPRAAVPAGPVHVVLAATADLHGAIDGRVDKVGDPAVDLSSGGIELLATYVKSLRAAYPERVLLLDAGDQFQGTLASNAFEGEPIVKAFDAMGLTAAALGNHEFDYGPVGPVSVAHEGQDPFGALERNVALAHYPFLACNVEERSTHRRPAWIQPWKLVDVAGVKVGIIGLATPTTPSVTNPINVKTLHFTDPVAATVAAAAELRRQGAAVVVAVAHIGGACKDFSDPNDIATCEPSWEVFKLARALPAGTLDLFFGGHTHREVRHVVNGLPILQPASHGRGLAVVDLFVDPATNRVLADRTVLRPHAWVCPLFFQGTDHCDFRRSPKGAVTMVPASFEGRPVTPDPGMHALLAPYLAKVEAKRSEKLGVRLAAALFRNSREETPLGNLVADAQKEVVPNAQLSFMNAGGLRADLPAGDLTYGHVFELLPFDNQPATLEMTGAQVRELIRMSVTGTHGLLYQSGLKVTARARKGEPLELQVTLADGSPLGDDTLYTAVASDYLVSGGSGFDEVVKMLPPERVRILHDHEPVREEIIPVLKRWAAAAPGGVLAPRRDGRMVLRKD